MNNKKKMGDLIFHFEYFNGGPNGKNTLYDFISSLSHLKVFLFVNLSILPFLFFLITSIIINKKNNVTITRLMMQFSW